MDDIDTLTGRPLDAMVAQYVFGLEVVIQPNSGTGIRDYFQRASANQDWESVPTYSTEANMAAAILLEMELRRRGWRREPPVWHDYGGHVVVFLGERVQVVLRHDDSRTVVATGMVNEALCRAAIKAVGASRNRLVP